MRHKIDTKRGHWKILIIRVVNNESSEEVKMMVYFIFHPKKRGHKQQDLVRSSIRVTEFLKFFCKSEGWTNVRKVLFHVLQCT